MTPMTITMIKFIYKHIEYPIEVAIVAVNEQDAEETLQLAGINLVTFQMSSSEPVQLEALPLGNNSQLT